MVNYAGAFSQSELGKYFEWIINSLNGSHKLTVYNLQSTDFFQTGVYNVAIPLNTYCFVSLKPSQIVELKQISLFIIRQVRHRILMTLLGFNKHSSAKNGALSLSILRESKNIMWKKLLKLFPLVIYQLACLPIITRNI